MKRLKPDARSLRLVRPSASLELVRVHLPFHRVEEFGPRVRLERRHPLAGFAGPALRAGVVHPFLAQLVKDLEDMGALDAFIIV